MKHEYKVSLEWKRNNSVFTDNKYSRVHVLRLETGAEINMSSSPSVVPIPYSDPSVLDPEVAFVGSISSCHMLWALSVFAKKKFVVDRYSDNPVGIMTKDDGSIRITEVTLCPEIIFSGPLRPSNSEIREIHEEAHHLCYIANSVRTKIHIQPVFPA